MSRLARRAVIIPKGSGAKVYSDFVARITSLATNGVAAWSADSQAGGSYRTTAAAATGTMYGSPWMDSLFPGATVCRIIQHGLPSEAVFNAQIAGSRQIFFVLTSGVSGTFNAVNRNGYESLGSGTSASRSNCTQILYWSGTDTGGSAFQMNPSTGTGPTPYTW